MDDRRPRGHGDFANLIRAQWNERELLQVAEEILELERHPGFARLCALLDSRESKLVDRLVDGEPGDVRATDQVLGIVSGLRQSRQAVDSILHEANQARERATHRAREADAEGAQP